MDVERMIFVSKYTRRRLLLMSFSGIVFFLTEGQWMSIVAVVALLSYVLAYGVGLGNYFSRGENNRNKTIHSMSSSDQFLSSYHIGAEMFKQGPKPAAMSLGCWVNWTCNLIYAISFPSLQTSIVTAALIVIHRNLPETKDKHIADKPKNEIMIRNQEKLLGSTKQREEQHGDRPSDKTNKCIVAKYTQLKDTEEEGYEAWYTPGRKHMPATGYLEEQLRNVRKRSNLLTNPQGSADDDLSKTPRNKHVETKAIFTSASLTTENLAYMVHDKKCIIAIQGLPLAFGVPLFRQKIKTTRISYEAAFKAFVKVHPREISLLSEARVFIVGIY
uniref:Uncharacterized protein n=1 Tax=Strigamia maritima TaxID=126957 RepID=T1IKW9_STRMM